MHLMLFIFIYISVLFSFSLLLSNYELSFNFNSICDGLIFGTPPVPLGFSIKT